MTASSLSLSPKVLSTRVNKNPNSTFTVSRSNCPEVFGKKGVLRYFAKFIEKHLCQSLFFNKVAGFILHLYKKKRVCHRSFPVNFVKFLRTPFLKEHLWWLLLYYGTILLTRLPVEVKNLREHNLRQNFQDSLDLFCSCGWHFFFQVTTLRK